MAGQKEVFRKRQRERQHMYLPESLTNAEAGYIQLGPEVEIRAARPLCRSKGVKLPTRMDAHG